MLTRRFLLAANGVVLSCFRPRRGSGFPGHLFVANAEGRAVAAVDLTAFAVTRHIPLDGNPSDVLTDRSRPFVYALTPESRQLTAIGAGDLKAAWQLRLPGRPASARITADGSACWVLSSSDRLLTKIDLARRRIDRTIPLAAEPAGFDVAPAGAPGDIELAVAMGEGVAVLPRAAARLSRVVSLDAAPGLVCFRKDGRAVLVTGRQDRQVTLLDPASGRIIVRLDLGITPRHYCVKPDGGEVHFTGHGADAVVTVYPYLTEVRGTMLAGRGPGFLAVSPSNLLLVANPEANNVTIINSRNQRVLAIAATGRGPCHIAITPDGEYALVLNQLSGDVSVLRLTALTSRRPSSAPAAPAFTMIPVGSGPVSAVVRAI
jgi:DNA-binding beta-propeller fold protein YncE